MKKVLAVVFVIAAIFAVTAPQYTNHPPIMGLESHQHESQTDIA